MGVIGLYLVGVVLLVIALALALNAAMNEAPLWSAVVLTILAVLAFVIALTW
ncbi:MAG TPA: hypothetical protein VGR63_13090 [Casimicrobiaceae bacterium]|jgi:hypothetical protein|nr:hypothetical protein [Casimicrobiaceae bacterium]